jgi:hypothetical protein
VPALGRQDLRGEPLLPHALGAERDRFGAHGSGGSARRNGFPGIDTTLRRTGRRCDLPPVGALRVPAGPASERPRRRPGESRRSDGLGPFRTRGCRCSRPPGHDEDNVDRHRDGHLRDAGTEQEAGRQGNEVSGGRQREGLTHPCRLPSFRPPFRLRPCLHRGASRLPFRSAPRLPRGS